MFSKLLRIGRDCELRYTQGGTAVSSISGAYNVGFGDKKRTQWIDCVMWGKQAESLSQYLKKGGQVVVYADDLEIESYEHNGNQGSKLKCRVIGVDLCGGKPEGQQQGSQQIQQRQQPQQQQSAMNNNFDDDMDLPF